MMDKTIQKIEGLISKGRNFRRFANFELRADEKDGFIVEGYAAVFDSPTVLYSFDGVDYKEQVDRKAFQDADMTDIIFNYNHGGKVVARTRNKTLQVNTDDTGLFMRAKLDGTEEGRRLYEEIKGGYIDRMSFSFTEDAFEYDKKEHLRSILKVKKLYDVSAVDIPAYDDTSISARSFFEPERAREQRLAEAAKLRKRLLLKTELTLKGVRKNG